MTDKATQLISDFRLNGWKTNRLYERLFELSPDTGELHGFLEEYLAAFDESATFFNDALSYINEAQFEKLVQQSLDILRTTKNENAEEVILYASLQFPHLLHDKLKLIFELKPNERTYYAGYP